MSAMIPSKYWFSSPYFGIQADFPLTLMSVRHVHAHLHHQDIYPFLHLALSEDVVSIIFHILGFREGKAHKF